MVHQTRDATARRCFQRLQRMRAIEVSSIAPTYMEPLKAAIRDREIRPEMWLHYERRPEFLTAPYKDDVLHELRVVMMKHFPEADTRTVFSKILPMFCVIFVKTTRRVSLRETFRLFKEMLTLCNGME